MTITVTPRSPVDLMYARTTSLQELRAAGLTRRDITRAIADGGLVRLRNGRYARPDLPGRVLKAGAAGGRLDCVSLLHLLGAFVRDTGGIHLQFDPHSSRHPPRDAGTVAHWRRSCGERADLVVNVVDALAQAVQCQSPRDAVATVDSALHLRLIDEIELAAVFERVPRRLRRLRPLVDGRAESGPETLMRLILRSLGCSLRLQAFIPTVGRVDLVVNGWLIVECDSRAHHDGWDAHRRDRRRDAAAAALGFTTVRILAEDILHRHDDVVDLMRRIVAHPRAGVQNSVR